MPGTLSGSLGFRERHVAVARFLIAEVRRRHANVVHRSDAEYVVAGAGEALKLAAARRHARDDEGLAEQWVGRGSLLSGEARGSEAELNHEIVGRLFALKWLSASGRLGRERR